ncbi:hypothetical protein FFLO_05441 [Filobasidium floriforme]|uniref:Uncharacterized protein n=1 Tax=Filobasidium floriforme TaxID=5210 RepID=A0A8K0JGZ0_9TREE|nr:hypothetical protein FFLO_05441 [Filobasidium floriforme]
MRRGLCETGSHHESLASPYAVETSSMCHLQEILQTTSGSEKARKNSYRGTSRPA